MANHKHIDSHTIERVQRGFDLIDSIKDEIEKGSYNANLEADVPEYSIRPFGLLAGPTNELYLARWYINEFYLEVNAIKMLHLSPTQMTSRH